MKWDRIIGFYHFAKALRWLEKENEGAKRVFGFSSNDRAHRTQSQMKRIGYAKTIPDIYICIRWIIVMMDFFETLWLNEQWSLLTVWGGCCICFFFHPFLFMCKCKRSATQNQLWFKFNFKEKYFFVSLPMDLIEKSNIKFLMGWIM